LQYFLFKASIYTMTRFVPLAFAFLLLARPAVAQQPADTSLYVRVGGVPAIALVVDYFVDRLEWNPVIRANPAVRRAFAEPIKPGLKYRLTEMVCAATGGPCTYGGRPMDEAHDGLGITEAEWQAMVQEFQRALLRFHVPAQEQKELLAVVATTKEDIVAAP
jgi:hemoglobin